MNNRKSGILSLLVAKAIRSQIDTDAVDLGFLRKPGLSKCSGYDFLNTWYASSKPVSSSSLRKVGADA